MTRYTSAIYFICPKCKKRYAVFDTDAMSFCESCGTKLIKKCSKCEAEITSSNAEYCRNCGTKYIKDNL